MAGFPAMLEFSGVVFDLNLPVNHRTISAVVGFGVAPVVAELVLHGLFIQFDAQARGGGNFDVAGFYLEGLLDVAFAQADLFLAQKIGYGGDHQDASCQRTGVYWVVWGQGGILGHSHTGNEPGFHDATGVAEIRLQDARSAFF